MLERSSGKKTLRLVNKEQWNKRNRGASENMISYLPEIDDGRQYYMLVPMLATLYGRDDPPYRFLRVTDTSQSGRFSISYESEAGNPDTMIIVESVDLETFIEFASYGYSPYIECALSGYKDGLNMDEDAAYFMTQALLRNYQSRTRTLLSICERKQYSIANIASSGTQLSNELRCELAGAEAMWEMTMNTGRIYPQNCLENLPGRQKNKRSIRDMKREASALDDRLDSGEFSNQLPYKISDDDRNRFFRRYGLIR